MLLLARSKRRESSTISFVVIVAVAENEGRKKGFIGSRARSGAVVAAVEEESNCHYVKNACAIIFSLREEGLRDFITRRKEAIGRTQETGARDEVNWD